MARPVPSEAVREHEEHAIERFIGNLLRVCVIATVAIVNVGAALFLPGSYQVIPTYSKFIGEGQAFRSVTGILGAAIHGDGRAIVQAGMLLLILTPILRVAFSAFAFLYEKDYLYVLLTLIVLGLLLFSLLSGQ